MPSRPILVLIAAFWFATLGLVAYRDVWPRLAAAGPPPVVLDLQEEARPNSQVHWKVLRDGVRTGRLATQVKYLDAGDTFQFTHQYTQLTFEGSGVRVVFPDLTVRTRVSRAGDLREQSIKGKLVVQLERRRGDVTEYDMLGEAKVVVDGRVEGGVFRGRCEIESPLFSVKRDLEPVAVPAGQVLNPLQPVNRIAGIRPGQRWFIQIIDPLGEAVAALFKELFGKFLPTERKPEQLLAEVGSTPQPLAWNGADVPCWVIEYRDGEARARTWVRVSDGQVLRQEAFGLGERLTLEREE